MAVENEVRLGQRADHSANLLIARPVFFPRFVGFYEIISVFDKLLHPDVASILGHVIDFRFEFFKEVLFIELLLQLLLQRTLISVLLLPLSLPFKHVFVLLNKGLLDKIKVTVDCVLNILDSLLQELLILLHLIGGQSAHVTDLTELLLLECLLLFGAYRLEEGIHLLMWIDIKDVFEVSKLLNGSLIEIRQVERI